MTLLNYVLSSFLSLFLIAITANGQDNGCQTLEARFPAITFFPVDVQYANDSIDNWSQTCQKTPTCIFEPRTAQDVADGLAILRKANYKFALRSGGHMPVPGASSISNGVLVSTERFTNLEYAQGKSIIQIGAGLRWESVYDFLAQSSLAVAGGRFGHVGVSGLLLGGGISYFGSQYGWGASTVTNYEVVLANGTITTASHTTNPDLFWALKGGSSNFGIVTRFDMKTFTLEEMWGGTALYNGSALNAIVEAYASYTVAQGGSSDPRTHIDPSILINATTGEVSIYSVYMHTGSDPDPASARNFTGIPTTFSDLRVGRKINGLKNDTNPPNFQIGGLRQIFSSTALKSSAEAIYMINTTLFDAIAATPELKSVENLSVTNTYQTLTSAMLKAARAAGGDALDLDDPNGNGISCALYGANWSNAKDDDVVNRFIQKTVNTLDARSKAAGLYYDFIYLNDAAGSQKEQVLKTYGGGKSLPRLKEIAKRYDPDAVFQKLLPGGFKLGA